MITYTRFRLHRLWRRLTQRIRHGWQTSIRYIRFNLFGKWRQFAMIRRFALGWWFVIAFCFIGLVLQVRAVGSEGKVLKKLPGGGYSEALVGQVKNLNPILPEGSAAASADRLIFSGLTRFDTNGNLQPDLATSWTISADGKTYTFKLRKGVTWHDNVPFTSQDVAFTLAAIQNPDTRSPLSASWQGVKVTAPDESTVVFTLPKPYTPFINATTVGLLPRHLLENTEPSALRVSQFNQHPVGTGPYKLQTFDSAGGEIGLAKNDHYYLGNPLITTIDLRLYESNTKAFEAYNHRQVLGAGGITSDELKAAQDLGTMKLYEANTPDQVAVFLRTTSPILQDATIRKALNLSTNRSAIVQQQLGGQATALASPLLSTSVKLGGAPHQPGFDLAGANQVLEAAGWKKGSDGVRSKNGQQLKLDLVTQSDTTYAQVADALQQQWQAAGVKLNVIKVDGAALQQSYIRTRHYDALLYGVNMGADPDVYAFWDSSQVNDPGLNLSAYKSAAADKALESGRIITDPNLRAVKYKSFVQAFVADTPAIMLYTPTYIYGVDESVHGIHIHKLVTPADRFNDVQNWSVKVKAVPARSLNAS